jgi:predicted phosphodiesterase
MNYKTFTIIILAGLALTVLCCTPPTKKAPVVQSAVVETPIAPVVPNPDPLPDSYSGAEVITLVRGPYLQNVSKDAVTLMWETTTACTGLVEYYSGEVYNYSEADENGVVHEIRLTGLPEHASDIAYRIRCIDGTADFAASPTAALIGEKNSFRLAPTAEEKYLLAVYGDTRSIPEDHEKIVDRMVAENPDLVFNLGDLVGHGDEYETWDPQFFAPLEPLMKTVPLFAVPGNHEHDSDNFYNFLSQPPPENYFAFTYGNSFNIALDTNFPYMFPGSDMMDWFEEVLNSDEAREATWLFAYAHHPPYCEGRASAWDGDPGVREWILPLAEQFGIDIFFTGHTHTYERGTLNGVVWIVSGGGGAPLYPCTKEIEHIEMCLVINHYLRVEIDGTHLDYKAIDDNGNVIDAFELNKSE